VTPRKEIVSILHGVDTDARWYTDAENALSPHFEIHPFRYKSFRRLGKLKALLNPWSLGFGFILSISPFYGSLGLWQTLAIEVMALCTIPISLWLAGRSRMKVVADYQNHLAKIPTGERPHLIAHSFGTYIGTAAMRDHPQRSYAKVVFAGCVLPVDIDWKKIHDRGYGGIFREVRNEVSTNDEMDPLIRAAVRVGMGRVFGQAGTRGFTSSVYVHSQQNLWQKCNVCKTSGPALVHNVQIDLYHSGMLGSNFMESFWLPFLWDIHPAEYRDFLEVCDKLNREQNRDAVEFRKDRAKFLRRQWGWVSAQGGGASRTLTAAISAQIEARISPGAFSPDVVKTLSEIAAERTWRAVARAKTSSVNSPERRHLDPKYATFDAAKRALEFHRRSQRAFKAS
jgi:pimeloyl-ACP methyl ester carboxylesterase